MSTGGITIIDVMRELRIEPTPHLSWQIGMAVRDAYERRFGYAPEKALRTKTNGPGSHCFAIYPRVMRETIVQIIRQFQTEAQRQGDLFS